MFIIFLNKLLEDTASIFKQDDRLTNFLKKVKKSIREQLCKELYPRGSQPGIMYGLNSISH